LQTDLGLDIPKHGNLEKWAEQGVLLLNASLTVRANEPMSHSKTGWEIFTGKVLEILNEEKENLVFLLWGKFAQQKKSLINMHKHLVLEAAHPSPFSAYNGFFGCRHFSKVNGFLQSNNMMPIDWAL
jgi:uracil-DNA glycosylase